MITSYRDFKLGKNLYRFGKKGLIYCRFRVNGKEIRRSTGKKDERLAQDAAWDIFCDAAGINETPKAALRRSTYPLISEIGKIYMDEISKFGACTSKTAKSNYNTLTTMLSCIEMGDVRLDKLTAETVEKWREARYQRVGKTFGIEDDLKLNYSLNSSYSQAKAVFSKNAMKLYKSKGLKLPANLKDFCEAGFLKQMDTRFVPIPKDIDEKIKLACELSLTDASDTAVKEAGLEGKIPDKKIAVAVELARYAGLTAKEIAGIRWEWFEEIHGVPVIAIRYRPAAGDVPAWESKGNKKNGNVPVRAERVARWRSAFGAENKTSGYVFDFPKEWLRIDFVKRTVSQWVAQFLPDREKKLHELRKQAGSEVATKEGIYAAARFLRDTVIVAERHYASLLKQVSAL